MKKNTLLILGDSTSMTIGMERRTYPFLLAGEKCWPEFTEIVNCSQPGITSADACAFFFKHRNDHANVRATIIHLGTCDAASSEIHKGRYTYFQQIKNRSKTWIGIRRKRTSLKNRLLYFTWNNSYNHTLEAAEKPSDYEFNLTRIIRSCKKSSIPVILIRPKSNPLFPPGIGKGNFVFYCYLGIKDRISDRIFVPDRRFKEAWMNYETGNYSQAIHQYKEILLHSDDLASHPEYPLVVTNNYAVATAENGNYKEAEHLFELLLKEPWIRKEIILFNLAQLSKRKGDLEKYTRYLQESYEADSSLYRIRAPYLQAIDRIACRFSDDIKVIDMGTLIEDASFIDHCHPLTEAQKKIADQALYNLRAFKISGNNTATVKNILYNPELSLGNEMEFYTYFKTYSSLRSDRIHTILEKLTSDLRTIKKEESIDDILATIPSELKRALEHYLRHPCFPSIADVLHFGPQYPSDIGRFPEFFLVRHLIPYMRIHERETALQNRFSRKNSLLHTSEELLRILPSSVVPLVSISDPIVDPQFESDRLLAILKRVRDLLKLHLHQGNQIHERLKTTIFWFFRETLRYGTHSRYSMRYDRTFLEYAAEALAIAGVLNLKMDAGKVDEIEDLISCVEETVDIHENYCRRFSLKNDCSSLLEEYDSHLIEIANGMEQEAGVKNVYSRNISLLS